MARKPVCRVCGYPHWSSEPHNWPQDLLGDAAPEAEVAAGAAVDLVAEQVFEPSEPTGTEVTTSASSTSTERVKRWREKNRSSYNAYQREYMRRYRSDAG